MQSVIYSIHSDTHTQMLVIGVIIISAAEEMIYNIDSTLLVLYSNITNARNELIMPMTITTAMIEMQ